MLAIVFGLSLLDRSNISAAYIAGLADDLRLDIGARYSIALLVFVSWLRSRKMKSLTNQV